MLILNLTLTIKNSEHVVYTVLTLQHLSLAVCNISETRSGLAIHSTLAFIHVWYHSSHHHYCHSPSFVLSHQLLSEAVFEQHPGGLPDWPGGELYHHTTVHVK